MTKPIQRMEIAKDFLQETVDNAVNSVQKVHNTVSDTCFEVAANWVGNSDKLSKLRSRHDQTVNTIYEAIRSVNHTLGGLASEVFGTLEDSAYVNQVMDEKAEEAKVEKATTKKPGKSAP